MIKKTLWFLVLSLTIIASTTCIANYLPRYTKWHFKDLGSIPQVAIATICIVFLTTQNDKQKGA